MELKVRVSETDALGHINNKSYFDYMEESRNHFFEQIFTKEDTEGDRYTFILAKACCEYLMQGYYGQTLKLKTTLKKIGTKSLTLETYIHNKETGDLIAKGNSTVVLFDIKEQKSLAIPAGYKERLLNNQG